MTLVNEFELSTTKKNHFNVIPWNTIGSYIIFKI